MFTKNGFCVIISYNFEDDMLNNQQKKVIRLNLKNEFNLTVVRFSAYGPQQGYFYHIYANNEKGERVRLYLIEDTASSPNELGYMSYKLNVAHEDANYLTTFKLLKDKIENHPLISRLFNIDCDFKRDLFKTSLNIRTLTLYKSYFIETEPSDLTIQCSFSTHFGRESKTRLSKIENSIFFINSKKIDYIDVFVKRLYIEPFVKPVDAVCYSDSFEPTDTNVDYILSCVFKNYLRYIQFIKPESLKLKYDSLDDIIQLSYTDSIQRFNDNKTLEQMINI